MNDSNYTVGSTVELTAPEVYAKDGKTALTVGKDFYYQWQYSTDYNANPETATWINFSAPAVNDTTIRVTIGDANTALQYALLLAGYCKTVHVCTLFDKFFADKALVDRLLDKQKDNVKIYHNINLRTFCGEDELDGLDFENTVTGKPFHLDCKAAFICIGQIPSNSAFESIVELDKYGYIVAGEDCKTSCPGIFAAGDCRTKAVRQMVTAAADGSVASLAACKYIDETV